MTTASGPVPGPDGRLRCPWAPGGPPGSVGEVYARYHDEEWGRPVHGTGPLFERLVLEGFQSGLSWITVLRKRPAFRAAFAGFDPVAVAAFVDDDVERLLQDPGIVRNRAKVVATVANARAVLALDVPLDELLWSYAPPAPQPAPATTADVPTTTPAST